MAAVVGMGVHSTLFGPVKYAYLPQQWNASMFKFIAQAGSVNRFQQPRPSVTMHFDSQSDNSLRQVSMFKHDNISPRPSAALPLSPC